jgi:hypothetical protein
MNCEEAVKVKSGLETGWTYNTLRYPTMGSSKKLTSTATGWEDFYTNLSEADCPIDPTSCKFLGTGTPTKCGKGSDSSVVPGTTESCGASPNAIVKFESGTNPSTDTKIVA